MKHKLDLKAGANHATGVDDFDGHPMNYFVPDLGLDEEVVDSLNHLSKAEKKSGHKFTNKNYFIHSRWSGERWNYVQVDEESGVYIDKSREPLVSYGKVDSAAPKSKITHPINYSVPNFGVDSDIADSQANLKNTEKRLKHKLNLVKGGNVATGVDNFDNHPMNYKVPSFGMDQDIKDSLKNLKDSEKRLGKWKV